MTEHTQTDQTVTQPPTKLLDISPTQLIGGSLAAATAAALGSRLGVVGTITGAAVGSVVTAIAASLYTGSMARARDVIATTRSPGRRPSPVAARADVPTAPAEGVPPAVPLSVRRARMAPLRSAVAVFVVAAAFLAGFQLATGTSVTGTAVGTRPEVALPGAEPPSADSAVAGPAGISASGDPVPPAATAPPTTRTLPTGTATEKPVAPEQTSAQPQQTAQPEPATAPTSVGGTPTVPVTPTPLG
jgi:hypothetical protein